MSSGSHWVTLLPPEQNIPSIVIKNWNSLKLFTEKDHARVQRNDTIRNKYRADDVISRLEAYMYWPAVDEFQRALWFGWKARD